MKNYNERRLQSQILFGRKPHDLYKEDAEVLANLRSSGDTAAALERLCRGIERASTAEEIVGLVAGVQGISWEDGVLSMAAKYRVRWASARRLLSVRPDFSDVLAMPYVRKDDKQVEEYINKAMNPANPLSRREDFCLALILLDVAAAAVSGQATADTLLAVYEQTSAAMRCQLQPTRRKIFSMRADMRYRRGKGCSEALAEAVVAKVEAMRQGEEVLQYA